MVLRSQVPSSFTLCRYVMLNQHDLTKSQKRKLSHAEIGEIACLCDRYDQKQMPLLVAALPKTLATQLADRVMWRLALGFRRFCSYAKTPLPPLRQKRRCPLRSICLWNTLDGWCLELPSLRKRNSRRRKWCFLYSGFGFFWGR